MHCILFSYIASIWAVLYVEVVVATNLGSPPNSQRETCKTMIPLKHVSQRTTALLAHVKNTIFTQYWHKSVIARQTTINVSH